MKWLLLLSFLLSLIACNHQATSLTNSIPSTEGSNGEDPTPTPAPTPIVDEGANLDEKLFICSSLDFSSMLAPKDLSDIEINVFALGLNISASFEGVQGWKNITNNFDGMGLSLGLLNQTLGTGSLQPLLVRMLEKHEAKMKAQYSEANYNSIKAMALEWKDDTGFIVNQIETVDLFAPNDSRWNALDEGDFASVQGAAESKSVAWALGNIYQDSNGRVFKADWKTQLQTMASSGEYRDLQFAAARVLHNKAIGYVNAFSLSEIRSYLFMFDIVVQNGGFYQKNFDDFRSFMAANPNATEEQKLRALLASRLVQVRSQYREDVRSRKEGIIDGHGRVHQTDRNFETEYCYRSIEVIN
ncbi:MAG: hypothetical protein KDD37_06190 [Bdellovibrionales bacterium]|nr:hypothetical protein [Bdellovibrionales bacterium]